MRVNTPVTNIEESFRDGEIIVSRTDLRGVITYVNPYFCEISGYSEQESLGQPQNFIRHPDMPEAAFADLWRTIKSGRPWTGMVKNRCKNGNYYWVEANVTPVQENGQTIGYMSVRCKPTRQQVEAAAALYQRLREGKSNREIVGGQVRRRSALRRLNVFSRLGLTSKLTIGCALVASPLLINLVFEYAGLEKPGMTPLVIGLVGTLLAGALMSWLMQRAIVEPMRASLAVLQKISQGDFRERVPDGGEDELGTLLRGLKSMQIRLDCDLDESRRTAQANARIKEALDNVATGVMIADQDLNIIYVNRSVVAAMKTAEADIRKERPEFEAERMLGSNADFFHKNPMHQRQMLKNLTRMHEAQIAIGARSFRLRASPVVSERGERLGTAVEWLDVTAELQVQSEINRIVAAAAAGDLTQRIAEDGKTGFMKNLAEGVNLLTSGVSAAIDDTLRVIESMAQGDLAQTIERECSGTFLRLKQAVNNTVATLSTMIADVRTAADAIAGASDEVSSAAQSLSQSSNEQAASVEETSASIEEMTASISQNTENSKVTEQMATKAAREANEGGEAVRTTVEAMKQIAHKISIIDDIAYKTNLLALNAAIEAARAGEHGKGFAVVAAEVRKLAERSQVAAEEIGEVAASSVMLAERAGSLLGAIVPSIGKTSDLVQEITAASQEQSAGVGQINTAMSQLSQLTQQNASASEELAATSEDLSSQAQRLLQTMSFFAVQGGGEQPEPVAAAAARRGAPARSGKDVAGRSPSRGTHRLAPVREAAAADGDFIQF
jgi:methyl-accepting chemotaxis protein